MFSVFPFRSEMKTLQSEFAQGCTRPLSKTFFLFWPFVRWSHAWQYSTGPILWVMVEKKLSNKRILKLKSLRARWYNFFDFFSLPSFPPRRMHLKKRMRVIATTRVVSKLQCTQHLRTTGCMHTLRNCPFLCKNVYEPSTIIYLPTRMFHKNNGSSYSICICISGFMWNIVTSRRKGLIILPFIKVCYVVGG